MEIVVQNLTTLVALFGEVLFNIGYCYFIVSSLHKFRVTLSGIKVVHRIKSDRKLMILASMTCNSQRKINI
jgi:hypothetical protein